jgi:hypothetical protein
VVAVAATAPAMVMPQLNRLPSSATIMAPSSVTTVVLLMGSPCIGRTAFIRNTNAQRSFQKSQNLCNDWTQCALFQPNMRGLIMRSGCLWLLGVPIPIILLLWLITGHA